MWRKNKQQLQHGHIKLHWTNSLPCIFHLTRLYTWKNLCRDNIYETNTDMISIIDFKYTICISEKIGCLNHRDRVTYVRINKLDHHWSLQWRHNGHDSVSNHQTYHCLLNRLFSADQRKYQNSASLAFVRGIHRRPVNSPHKWPVTRKMFPFDDVIMFWKWHLTCLAPLFEPMLLASCHVGL